MACGRSDDPQLPKDLQWIAQTRGLLFHGTQHGDLDVLEPIRRSRDATAFGDQQAVFASSDPVWAIYFALLSRGGGQRSTRNGSRGVLGSLYPRRYLFSHTSGSEANGRFGDGWLYLRERVPSSAAVARALRHRAVGVPDPLTPIMRLRVEAEDFPFRDRVLSHKDDERMSRTVLRAARSRR